MEKADAGAMPAWACIGLPELAAGGTLFAAATTGWACGLQGKDPIVEIVTRNVLDRLSG